MNSKSFLIKTIILFLIIEIEAAKVSYRVRSDFGNARRNRRQSGYHYDKPKISFDLPNNRGSKPSPSDKGSKSDQGMEGYSSGPNPTSNQGGGYPKGQPSPPLGPSLGSDKSPDLPGGGYPQDPPPNNSLLPGNPPQSQPGGYPSDKPQGNGGATSYNYDAPSPIGGSSGGSNRGSNGGSEVSTPDKKYISPNSAGPSPPGSTKGPPYLPPPKPPADSYTPNENPGSGDMVIVVPDVPQSIENSTPGSKYLPPFSPGGAPQAPPPPGPPPGPPKEKYVPPTNILPLPNPAKPPSSLYNQPNSGSNPTNTYSAPSPQTPNSLYEGPGSISTPASTYLPPYQ